MKKKRISLIPCYEILYMTSLAFGLLLTVNHLRGFSQPDFLLFAGSLFFLILLGSSRKHGAVPLIWGALLLLHLLAVLYLWYRHLEGEQFLEFLGLEAVCLSGAVLCYFAAKRLWGKGILLLLEFSLLITLSIMRIDLPKWGICVILAAAFLFLAELGSASADGLRPKKPQPCPETSLRTRTVCSLIPVLAFLMLLFTFFPVKSTPIRWETFQKAANLISEKTHALVVSLKYAFSDSSLYSVSFTGYGPGGELGGNLTSSDNIQISVNGSRTNNPLYLTGTVYNTYTGDGWEVRDTPVPYDKESYRLQHSKLNAIFKTPALKELGAQATHACHMDITYEGLKTKSIFYAPGTWNFSFQGSTSRNLSGASLLLKRAQGVGFTYGLRFMEVDYSNKEIQKLLSAPESLKMTSYEDKDAKELEAYSRYSRENYLSLPDSLPQRIRNLAEELTKECHTDYDRLTAIQQYLGNYSYTVRPGTPPEGKDFTEAFLFQTREGYCTYFATAMAVLGRCAGIPTRYVEGFATKDTCTAEDQTVYLSGSNAHAWTEAYLEPVGWVIFDAVPGYQQASHTPWNPQPAREADSDSPGERVPPNPPDDTSPDKNIPASVSSLFPVFAKVIAAALLLLCLLTLILFLRIQLRKHSYRKLTDYEKVLRLMEHILFIGKWKGYPMESWETLEDYQLRLSGALDTPAISFGEIHPVYQKIRFGSEEVKESERKTMEAYMQALQKMYLQNCGKSKFLSYLFKC